MKDVIDPEFADYDWEVKKQVQLKLMTGSPCDEDALNRRGERHTVCLERMRLIAVLRLRIIASLLCSPVSLRQPERQVLNGAALISGRL